MKHIVIEEHKGYCNNGMGDLICAANPQYFLFFCFNHFFLIEYFYCHHAGSIDSKLDIVKSVVNKNKMSDYYNVDRCLNYDKPLKEWRLRGIAIQKKVVDINYIFTKPKGSKIVIYSETDFFSRLANNDVIKENYENSKKYLNDKDLCFLLDELEELYLANFIIPPSDKNICASINEAIKIIRNTKQQNTKTQ